MGPPCILSGRSFGSGCRKMLIVGLLEPEKKQLHRHQRSTEDDKEAMGKSLGWQPRVCGHRPAALHNLGPSLAGRSNKRKCGVPLPVEERLAGTDHRCSPPTSQAIAAS